jgi:alanine dehydrogenase
MKIGVPKEIKSYENRVALTPQGARELIAAGHHIRIESGAGLGSGYTNEDYIQSGASIYPDDQRIWNDSELILKVKEPLESEYRHFRSDLTLFTYLHLASNQALTKAIIDSKMTAYAYETVQRGDGSLPLLKPMSEIAGKMAAQMGAHFLARTNGGAGVLLGGISNVPPGEVVILGGGVVGSNAAEIALGLGAQVTILDTNEYTLQALHARFYGETLTTLFSNQTNISESIARADLFIGAVLIPGDKAPTLVTESMVRAMKPGSVIVDVAVDQGGIVETIDRVTTHDNPVYEKHGVLHYAVANMPGAVPRTATIGLTTETLPFIAELASGKNISRELLRGINIKSGKVIHEALLHVYHENGEKK